MVELLYIIYIHNLLLYTVNQTPSQIPHSELTNRSNGRIGSLSQIIKKSMMAKWKTKTPSTIGNFNFIPRSFPLTKLDKVLPTPYSITVYPTT